jgi:serpin B
MTSQRFLLLAVGLMACEVTEPDVDPNRVARMVTSADGDMGVMVDGHNAFTWELYDELVDGSQAEGNVFFSPLSITSALGMTFAGAEGVTQTEMSQVLQIDLPEADWHAALGELTQDLSGDLSRGYTLHVANRLFGQTDYPWELAFLDVCDEAYGAPMEPWDFRTDPDGGRERVNAWVEEQTEERITDLLPPGSVDGDTRMVLANAIYFLADWAAAFDPDDTRDATFHRLDGSTVTVPMMSIDTETLEDSGIEVGSGAGFQVARLPYQDHEVAMYLVVPEAEDGLPDLEAGLDAATFDGWLDGLSGGEAIVQMPRLDITWEMELRPALTALGMGSAFEGMTADFTGMAIPPEDGSLFIKGIFHKAFVKVDEAGTEAAAATGVVMGTESAPPMVVADRPFLFVLRDDLTGTILFVGRVTDPS